jgi:hypothetical protein
MPQLRRRAWWILPDRSGDANPSTKSPKKPSALRHCGASGCRQLSKYFLGRVDAAAGSSHVLFRAQECVAIIANVREQSHGRKRINRTVHPSVVASHHQPDHHNNHSNPILNQSINLQDHPNQQHHHHCSIHTKRYNGLCWIHHL